ncbi:MAG: twin-arginine translocase subunit TatB [Hyphomicrobiales bacterium]|nr:twin-arginine translocase subunit TatB [Hyphomicrobiales bacterium]
MFDIAWSEMVVIGAVALIAIGPKDLPKALRAVGAMTAKARRMAAEFQDHFREAMREAELESVRQEVANIHQDLSATTSGLQSEFNSIGSQMPASSEPLVQPASPSAEATSSAGEAATASGAGKDDVSRGEASPTQVSGELVASPQVPAAKLSVEASPTAVIVTEKAETSSAEKSLDEKPSGEAPGGEKAKRKKRAASKAKPSAGFPVQGSLEIDQQSPSQDRPKPRKRAAKTLPPEDDRAA